MQCAVGDGGKKDACSHVYKNNIEAQIQGEAILDGIFEWGFPDKPIRRSHNGEINNCPGYAWLPQRYNTLYTTPH